MDDNIQVNELDTEVTDIVPDTVKTQLSVESLIKTLISRIARAISKEKAVSKLFEEHKNSPTAVVDKLVEHGIKLVPIA